MASQPPFIILSLPRSRSAWLAHFLSYPPGTVGHDMAVVCETFDQFIEPLASGQCLGTVETGAVIAWQLIRHRLPGARLVVVRRRVDDVMASFSKLGLTPDRSELEGRAELLDLVSGLPGVNTIRYEGLAVESCCAWLFEYCLGRAHEPGWWARLAELNIQIDMKARLQQLVDGHDRIERLKAEVLLAQRGLPGTASCHRLS